MYHIKFDIYEPDKSVCKLSKDMPCIPRLGESLLIDGIDYTVKFVTYDITNETSIHIYASLL